VAKGTAPSASEAHLFVELFELIFALPAYCPRRTRGRLGSFSATWRCRGDDCLRFQYRVRRFVGGDFVTAAAHCVGATFAEREDHSYYDGQHHHELHWHTFIYIVYQSRPNLQLGKLFVIFRRSGTSSLLSKFSHTEIAAPPTPKILNVISSGE
jgi:hypothetical protein